MSEKLDSESDHTILMESDRELDTTLMESVLVRVTTPTELDQELDTTPMELDQELDTTLMELDQELDIIPMELVLVPATTLTTLLILLALGPDMADLMEIITLAETWVRTRILITNTVDLTAEMMMDLILVMELVPIIRLTRFLITRKSSQS